DLKFMKGVVEKVKRGREFLRRELERLGLEVVPTQANFLMVNLKSWNTTAPELCEKLSKKKIYIRDLSGFKGAGKDYVRISVGRDEENAKLISELEKLRG
ncbi:MAG: aminotransferase class I/II-fold pyridoxal phosphate-dependent enzyme, partial [Candidatus Hadarchaeales archaeon]